MSDGRRFADESRNVLADQDEMHASVRRAQDEAMFHSPTPWRIATETGPCVIANGTREIAECYEDGEAQTTVDETNAAHIVKCVNERDGLVQALEDALEFLTGYEDVLDGDYGEPKPNAAMQLCNQIREALGRRPGP